MHPILHPNAAAAIDDDGYRLTGLLSVGPAERQANSGFTSRIPVGGTITDKDVLDEPLMSFTDPQGDKVARYFFEGKQRVGLDGDAYQELRKAVDKATRTKPFSMGLSREFLETETFKWCRDK